MTKTIEKKGWKKIAFGEVCKNLNVSAKDPLKTGIERYVGLEHIESGNLHIRTWGDVAEGTTFTKTFKPGHVLFGKRRPYLKKAAVADFAGICSGDILVFEADEKIIDSRLLPFIVSSDRFFDLAIQTSAGSLSPRTKFQDVAKFEFLLPPYDQQAKLAELLWAANEVAESYSVMKQSLELSKRKIQLTAFNLNSGDFSTIGETCRVKGRIGWRGYTVEDLRESGPFVIGAMHISKQNRIDLSDPTFISKEKYDESPDIMVEENDIILVKTGNTIGKLAIVDVPIKEATINPNVLIIRAQKIDPFYLYHFLVSQVGQEKIKEKINTTAQPAVNQESIKEIKIPLKPTEYLDEFVSKMNTIDASLVSIETLVIEAQQIKKQLINQIFSA